ncbi:MAG: DUF1564 family protein [Leptospiraceae bacterium]|nr:DUF1564 family protein [Leptospiraceae bacterium]
MRFIYNKNQSTKSYFYPIQQGTVSTLLIPERFFKQMENRFRNNYKMYGVLRFLLNKYRKFIASGFIPNSSKIKLRIQDKGQNLISIKFRPRNEDWVELGIWANGLGSSRCWLFSYLLELEFSLMGEFLCLPEIIDAHTTLTNSTPKIIWQFTEGKSAFKRTLHFRE